MKIRTIISAMALASLFFSSCENDDFLYRDQPRIRLEAEKMWSLGTDSLTYTFTTSPFGTTQQVINVDAVIMGNVANTDRVATIAVNPNKTTADASFYSFPTQVTIPAGQSKATFQVILKRAEELKQKEVALYIEVKESADFLVGTNEYNHVLIKWNDKITRPTNWDSLEEYFGTYSDTKYSFMLSIVPGVEYSTETMSWSQLMNYKVIFTNALDEFNAMNPGRPMTDENGVLIDFNN